MKTSKFFIRILSVGIVLTELLVFSGQVRSALAFPDTIIDEFTDTTTISQSGVGTNSGTFDDVGILGGERDLILNVTSGGGTLSVDTNTSFTGQLSHSAGTGVIGTTEITYDGNDSDASTYDPTGLGGIDMTANGNNAFILQVARDDLPGSITITANTDATSCSTLTLLIPGAIGATTLPRSFLFYFANFTTACASPADFTNIGGLQILVDDMGNDSLDLVVSVFAAVSVDFGDLDEISGNYNTQLADQGDGNIFGAGHVISSLFLGASVDSETDGQPNGNSDGLGDDQSGIDDEDGVVRPVALWTPGSPTGGHVQVTVNGDGCLYGWIDWNRNGTFVNTASSIGSTVNDRIIAQSVSAGTISIDFPVPTAFSFAAGDINARFRLYARDPGGSCWTGAGSFAKFPDRFQHYGGEVEDYTWSFTPTAITSQNLTARSTSGSTGVWLVIALLLGLATFVAFRYSRKLGEAKTEIRIDAR